MTTLREVAGYKTSDGKFWDAHEYDEAMTHQKSLEFRAWCYANICRGGEWDHKMVADAILEAWNLEKK